MRFVLIIFILFYIVFPAFAQEWEEIQQFVPNQSLHAIKFLDDQTGWTVSSLYNGSTYNIHKTTDGGENWTDQSSGYTATRFKDIWIHNSEKVTMVGNFGLIIQTEDGGENWTTIDSSLDHHLSGIFFVDDMLGFICGDAGTIIRTKDGGTNWEELNTGVIGVLNDVYFIDENNGFACGWNVMIKTEDGGESWTAPEFFPIPTTNYQMQKIDFTSPSTGYVCGDIGQILKTEDGGNTWDFFVSGTEESLQSIEFISDKIGFVCGFAGTILSTTDAGETWKSMISPTDQILFDIEFPSFGTGYICSWGGKILKLENMISSISEVISQGHFNVYPNPATTQLTIEWLGNKEVGQIELGLFDQSGNFIFHRTLENGDENISLEGISGGQYFMRLQNESGFTIEPLIIQNQY